MLSRVVAVVASVVLALTVPVAAPAQADDDLSGFVAWNGYGAVRFSVDLPAGVDPDSAELTPLIQYRHQSRWQDEDDLNRGGECHGTCTVVLPVGKYRVGVATKTPDDQPKVLGEWFGIGSVLRGHLDQYLDDSSVVEVKEHQTTDLGTLTPDRAASISGVSGFYPPRVDTRLKDGTWVTYTYGKSTGHGYRADGLAPGDYRLTFPGSSNEAFASWGASGRDVPGQTVTLGVAEQRTGIDNPLVEPGSLGAWITGPEGERVFGMSARLYYKQGDRWVTPPTDDRYSAREESAVDWSSFSGLVPGTYRLVYRYDNPSELTPDAAPEVYPGVDRLEDGQDIVVKPGEMTTVHVKLRPSSKIEGRVLDSAGDPVANVPVAAVSRTPLGWKDVSTARTDDDGTYLLPLLGGEDYRLRAGDPEEMRQDHRITYLGGVATIDDSDTVTPRPGGTTRADPLVMADAGRVSGRVTGAGGVPIAGAEVTISDFHPPTLADQESVTTDDDGRYTLPGVRAGTYRISVWQQNWIYHHGYWNGSGISYDAPYEGIRKIPMSGTQDATADVSLTPWTPETVGVDILTAESGDEHADKAEVGDVLRAGDVRWGPAPGITTSAWQWYRYDKPIPGATGPTYTVQPDDAEHYMYVKVSATSLGVTGSERSYATYVVDDTTVANPVLSDSTPVVGQTVTASARRSRSTARWQWLRDGTSISGATSATYRLGSADLNRQLSVRVRTTDKRGQVSLTSKKSARVARVKPRATLKVQPSTGRRVVLDVSLSAHDVSRSQLDSKVQISRVRSGSDLLRTARMEDGHLRVALSGQPRGSRTYYVTVVGSSTRMTSTTTRRVTVKVL